ncbi:RNA polymerase sigma factor [Xanthomarina sp. F2636L]|uniref:RNA polymerase sigma factor n=1 Tax=Xanthomarina sp. F2636L TaxID=2996018 RepID=UPI00225DE450|nr:RNA polymerase sigma factor [Xanthomarina sp. F2636L]MCX7549986.1 RNA polymerase sigma factor [Xanthomarina sp. F2636L]
MEAININDFNNHKIKEPEVIQRILAGEKELYEILVRRNNQKLYRVIRSYIKDEAEIEDLMQNIYIKGFTKLYQFKLESSFSTWLIRIAINESLARIREKGKLYHLNETSDNFKTNSILEIPDDKQLNPQQKMIRKEAILLVENAIDQLDIKYKTVYIMKEIEEMSTKEIALALNLSIANVKIRFHRAKTMLKDTLYNLSIDKNIFEFGFSRCDRITENVMKNI